jgi:peptidoglycan/LPS O-acetylase OafA/YrhL
VLSGFVISFTNDRKKHLGAREYFKDRAARIYSVALPVLALCLAMTWLFSPGDLPGDYSFALDHPLPSTFLNALFLGNIWFLSLPPYLDGPYWSLSYEVVYYAAFGLWFFARNRTIWLIGLAVIAGPKILLLFPWLIGVALNRTRERWTLSPAQAAMVAMSGVVVPVLMYAVGLFGLAKWLAHRLLGTHYGDFSNSVNFTGDYLTAIAFTIHLYGMYWLRLTWPNWLSSFARWGASIAFSLYLFHMPVLQIAKRLLGPDVASDVALVSTMTVIMLTCALLALITEQKRLVLKRWL